MSTAGLAPPTPALHARIAALQTAYAHRLDDLDLEAWPGFFTEAATYAITTRDNIRAGRPIGIITCRNRGMMEDRVRAFRTANVFEPHVYNHLLGPTEILDHSGRLYRTRTNFQVVRIMEAGRMDLLATGAYRDLILDGEAGLRFEDRQVVLDSSALDILLVIPL
jgi:anthranilate 1,2-dioxygenase small subunit